MAHARADGRPNYAGVVGEIQTCLAFLSSDPAAVRQDLVEMMNYNWSHFKPVAASSH